MTQTSDPTSPHSLVQPLVSSLTFFPLYYRQSSHWSLQLSKHIVPYIFLYLSFCSASELSFPRHGTKHHGQLRRWGKRENKKNKYRNLTFLRFVLYQTFSFGECSSIVIRPSRQRSVESVGTRSKTATMARHSWRATCAHSLFANPAMSMSVATVTNVALNATLPINTTKVNLDLKIK